MMYERPPSVPKAGPSPTAVEHIPVSLILAATTFAAHKHREQRRKGADASPYINHPIAVANVLANEVGIVDPITLAAALLHDTIEDTDTSAAELKAAFGPMVASVVVEVTDDKGLSKSTRKRLQIQHAAHLSKRARLVKLADKLCNLRDMSRSPPVDWPLKRRCEYFAWAKKVVDQMRGTSPVLDRLVKAELAHAPGQRGQRSARRDSARRKNSVG
jgi:GTP diphosphokinase / guanosine-3',5'-bis(diphosphate) 3'-diphosphatase